MSTRWSNFCEKYERCEVRSVSFAFKRFFTTEVNFQENFFLRLYQIKSHIISRHSVCVRDDHWLPHTRTLSKLSLDTPQRAQTCSRTIFRSRNFIFGIWWASTSQTHAPLKIFVLVEEILCENQMFSIRNFVIFLSERAVEICKSNFLALAARRSTFLCYKKNLFGMFILSILIKRNSRYYYRDNDDLKYFRQEIR